MRASSSRLGLWRGAVDELDELIELELGELVIEALENESATGT